MSTSNPPMCPSCGRAAIFVRRAWRCDPCDTRVGAHVDGTPLGTMADEETRRWRRWAHAAFDPLWASDRAEMTRRQAYAWLAEQLGLPKAETHIGRFDRATCERVLDAVARYEMRC